MKFISTLLCIGLIIGSLQSQNGCDGMRYVDTVFSQVDTTFAIKFGENTTFGGDFQELFMDIYEPVGDTLSDRPVIIWAFGGSFISGTRQQLSDLCQIYAQLGYVAVAIDYRLYDGPFFPFPDSLDFIDVAVKAMGDMKASIRKLREDAANGNPYRIDTSKIIVGGASAGAITATHVAYVDSTDVIPQYVLDAIVNNGGWEGNSSNNLQYSSEVFACVNYSGALVDANWMDANDPPLFSVHDDDDGVVPYGYGFASIGPLSIAYVEGSSILTQEAANVGVSNSLITIPQSSGHVSYLSGTWRDTVLTSTQLYLKDLICGSVILPANRFVAAPDLRAFPNPSEGDMMLQLTELPAAFDLVLYDAMGREVYRQLNINEYQVVIPRNNLAAGLYHLSIRFDDPKLPLVMERVLFR